MGTRRDPLGVSAWRSMAHRIVLRVESPFIRHWFKNRLLPSPTEQVGFQLWMLGKAETIRKGETVNSWHSGCQRLWSLVDNYEKSCSVISGTIVSNDSNRGSYSRFWDER